MADLRVDVRVAAGSHAGDVDPAYVVPHAWTDGGIAVEGGGTGAHLLLTAVGCCVLNDVFREAGSDVAVRGVLVEVGGDFDATTWAAASVEWSATVDSDAGDDMITQLVETVEAVAEIPRALRGEVKVERR